MPDLDIWILSRSNGEVGEALKLGVWTWWSIKDKMVWVAGRQSWLWERRRKWKWRNQVQEMCFLEFVFVF